MSFVISFGFNNQLKNIAEYRFVHQSEDKVVKILSNNSYAKNFKLYDNKKFILFCSGAVYSYLREVNHETISNFFIKENFSDTLKNIDGQFIVFFYNKVSKIAYLVRDKKGFRSVYYATSGKKILISDNQKEIAKHIGYHVNYTNLAKYISMHYSSFWGGQNNFFNNIKQLNPSSFLVIKNNLIFEKYYYNFKNQIESKCSENLIKKELKKLLSISVKDLFSNQINSNNTLLLLSGGMDSTVVAYLTCELGIKVDSLTTVYKSRSQLEESIYAKSVAKIYSKKWIKFQISEKIFLDSLKNCYQWHSVPCASSSILGYDIITNYSKKLGYENILTGGSSDNLFSGNHTDFLYNLADCYEKDNDLFNKELNNWVEKYNTNNFKKNFNVFLNFYNNNISKDLKSINPETRFVASKYLKKDSYNYLKKKNKRHNFKKIRNYLKTYNLYSHFYSALRPMLDGFNSIEKKYHVKYLDPYLDVRLQEICDSLPSNLKIRNGRNKYLLREIYKKNLPKKIINKETKIGFDVPFNIWMKKKPFLDLFLSQLDEHKNSEIKEFFDFKSLKHDLIKKNFYEIEPMFMWQSMNALLWLSSLKK